MSSEQKTNNSPTQALTQQEIEQVRALRNRGFAVSIFQPQEIPEGVSIEDVEDAMVAGGAVFISENADSHER